MRRYIPVVFLGLIFTGIGLLSQIPKSASGGSGGVGLDGSGNLTIPGTGPSGLDLLTGNGNNIASIIPTTNGSTLSATIPDSGNFTISATKSTGFSGTDTLDAAVITTVETAFATTYTIPANFLTTGRVLKVTMCFGNTSSASPASQRFRLRLGGLAGTIVFDTGAIAAITANMTGRNSVGIAYLQAVNTPGASINVFTGFGNSGSIPTVITSIGNTIVQPVAIATNASQVLTPTLLFGAGTAGNTVTLQQMIVESFK